MVQQKKDSEPPVLLGGAPERKITLPQIKIFFKGLLLGIAALIPGVCTGSLAVILHIYEPILQALRPKNLRSHLPFLFVLGLGGATGILCFSRLILYLIERHTMQVYYFFIGLIVGSIPMIYRKARFERLKPHNLLLFLLALSVMLLIAFTGEGQYHHPILRTLDALSFLKLFLAMLVSTFALILPGISGTFILLTLGYYETVIVAIAEGNLLLLIPVALGVVAGLFSSSQCITYLLRQYPQSTYMAILGLVVGSAFSIFPGFSFNLEGLFSLLFFFLAALLIYGFSRPED